MSHCIRALLCHLSEPLSHCLFLCCCFVCLLRLVYFFNFDHGPTLILSSSTSGSSSSPPPPLVFKPRCARRWDGLIIQANLAILSQSLMIQSLMIQSLMMQIQSLMLQSKYYHRPNYSYSYPPGLGQNHPHFKGFISVLKSATAILQREQCFCNIVNISFVLFRFLTSPSRTRACFA